MDEADWPFAKKTGITDLNQKARKEMKNLFLLAIVFTLCLGAAAMIQNGRASYRWKNANDSSHATSAPFRDGLYQGKLAAKRGDAPRVSTGRWATEADRASFAAGFHQGY